MSVYIRGCICLPISFLSSLCVPTFSLWSLSGLSLVSLCPSLSLSISLSLVRTKYASKLGNLADPKWSKQAVHCLNDLITNALQHIPDCIEFLSR